MRVMQIMAGAAQGGAEAFFERLTLALARRGLSQVAVIRKNEKRARKLESAGVPVVQLSFGGPLDLWTPFAIAREAKRFKPGLALAWMNRAAQKMPRLNAVRAGRLGGFYNLKYYRHCDHLIGNTQGIVNYMIAEGWPSERAHYLPNFVDPPAAESAPRASFDTPEDAPLVVALGRLHPNKAFDVFIDALAQAPGIWAWLAGEGPERAALEARAQEKGVAARLRFLGWRDDVPALVKAADIFVCPSRHEPLGNVVLEAFAAAKPVIAAASQGPSELIENGANGILVPVDDASTLAGAIRALAADRARAARLAQAGYATYSRSFTEDKVVDAYMAFFEKVTR